MIAVLRGLGYGLREIGRLFDVIPQAVSIMLHRHRRVLKTLSGSTELHGLSARAANALGRHRVRTREQARRVNVLALLRNERNCGRKTLDEIAHWMSRDLQSVDDSSDEDPAHTALSSRARSVLGHHGICTREQARRADLPALLQSQRNCGPKTLDEIARWISQGRRQLDGFPSGDGALAVPARDAGSEDLPGSVAENLTWPR